MVDFTINKDEHIKLIIDNFNFEKVHKVMMSLQWNWFAAANGVPTIEELKKTATRLLFDICKGDFTTTSTGGFKVTRYDDHLKLEFIISDYNSEELNTGPEYERRKKLKIRKKKINTININNNIEQI